MLKRTVSRGHDSPGPLTEANRLYLSRAQSGEPFFNAGRAPRFNLYSADSGAGPSNGGLSRLYGNPPGCGGPSIGGPGCIVKRVLHSGVHLDDVRRVTPVFYIACLHYTLIYIRSGPGPERAATGGRLLVQLVVQNMFNSAVVNI